MKPVIIGAGLAGLSVALALSPQPVIVLSPRRLGQECSSAWAQGGIAASLGADDSAALHAEDTMKAGGALFNAKIVAQVTQGAAQVIAMLQDKGVVFDSDESGQLRLGLEAAHSRRRIVHAAGDGTGAAIMKAMINAVRATPSITVMENTIASEILTNDGVTGVAIECNGEHSIIATDRVALATGGAGALWQHTTNPLGSWGSGLVLALRAGAELVDLEFMQFHPTAIDSGRDPMPLASEALRGEGAVLIDETGARFMEGQGKAELEPRDVVTRAIWNHMQIGHQVYLDATKAVGKKFAARFPVIYAFCMDAGIDPVTQAIPVRPAAHYHMGGVKTDDQGRSSVKGLWACGEVACTGLHGANRLASNSLLEAASFGRHVAESMSGFGGQDAKIRKNKASALRLNSKENIAHVRAIMSAHVGVTRDQIGLDRAIAELVPLALISDMALAGLMIAVAASQRRASIGAHKRRDFPDAEIAAQRRVLTLNDVLRLIEPPDQAIRKALGA